MSRRAGPALAGLKTVGRACAVGWLAFPLRRVVPLCTRFAHSSSGSLLFLQPQSTANSPSLFRSLDAHTRPRAVIPEASRGHSTAPCPCRGPDIPSHRPRGEHGLQPGLLLTIPAQVVAPRHLAQTKPKQPIACEPSPTYISQGASQILGLRLLAFSRGLRPPLRGSLH